MAGLVLTILVGTLIMLPTAQGCAIEFAKKLSENLLGFPTFISVVGSPPSTAEGRAAVTSDMTHRDWLAGAAGFEPLHLRIEIRQH